MDVDDEDRRSIRTKRKRTLIQRSRFKRLNTSGFRLVQSDGPTQWPDVTQRIVLLISTRSQEERPGKCYNGQSHCYPLSLDEIVEDS